MGDRYWVGGTANWDTTAGSKWATTSGGAGGAAVPTANDDVYFDANSGAVTVTLATTSAVCRSLDFDGFTGTFAYSGVTIVGIGATTANGTNPNGVSLRFSSGMTHNPTNNNIFNFNNTNTTSTTITTNGKTMPRCQFQGNRTLVFQDDVTFVGQINISGSTCNFNGKNVTFGSTSSSTCTISSGSLTTTGGTWTFALTSATTFFSRTGGTVTMSGSTIVVSAASANTRTFAGGGQTYGTLQYTVAGSTGALNITGSNTFHTIEFSDASNARTLRFTAGTTNTITTFSVVGTAGKLMSVESITAAQHTVAKTTGTVWTDYLSLTNSSASGGASWYAGTHSVDNGGNSGWAFSDPVIGAPAWTSLVSTVAGSGVRLSGSGSGAVASVPALTATGSKRAAGVGTDAVISYIVWLRGGVIADLTPTRISGSGGRSSPGHGTGTTASIVFIRVRGTAVTPRVPTQRRVVQGRSSDQGNRLATPSGSMRSKQVNIRQMAPLQQDVTPNPAISSSGGLTVRGNQLLEWNYYRNEDWYDGGEVIFDEVLESYGDKFKFTPAPDDPWDRPWTVRVAGTPGGGLATHEGRGHGYAQMTLNVKWPTDEAFYPLNAGVAVSTYGGLIMAISFAADEPPIGIPYESSGYMIQWLPNSGYPIRAFVIGLPGEEAPYRECNYPEGFYLPPNKRGNPDFSFPPPPQVNYIPWPAAGLEVTLGIRWLRDQFLEWGLVHPYLWRAGYGLSIPDLDPTPDFYRYPFQGEVYWE